MAVVLVINSQDNNILTNFLHLGPVDAAFLFMWGLVFGEPRPLVGEDM